MGVRNTSPSGVAINLLERTAGLPPIGGFTAMGWFTLSDTPGYQGGLVYGDAGFNYLFLGTDSDGVTFLLYTPAQGDVNGPVLSLGVPYHWALVATGTGLNQVFGYLDGQLVATASGVPTIVGTQFRLLSDGQGNRLVGAVSAVKMWDVALSAAEVAHEMWTIRPQRWANLNGWWPLLSTTDLGDMSAPGRDWTLVGTLIDDNTHAVAWGAPAGLVAQLSGAPPVGGRPRSRKLLVLGVG